MHSRGRCSGPNPGNGTTMRFQLIQHQIELDFHVKNHIDMLERHGVDVADLRRRLRALRESVPAQALADDERYNELQAEVLRLDGDTEVHEPWDLERIMAARPTPRLDSYEQELSDDDLRDRIHGAWLGRIAGCVLGKPLEWFMREEHSRPRVRKYLTEAGEYPLRYYASEGMVMPYYAILERKGLCDDRHKAPGIPALRGRIRSACADDDTNYTLIALRKCQRFGREFSLDDTIDFLYRAMGHGVANHSRNVFVRNRAMGLAYPAAASFMNDGRECVRLQIRTDLYGYISPGHMEHAARLAWHDAAATGVESGLYGALWTTACVAAAFVESDPEVIVQRGLEQIPAECAFRDELESTIDTVTRNGNDFDATLDDIDSRWNRYAPNLAAPNCAIIAAGLLHGKGDFARSLCLCVCGGYDTDSNGATLGSILGAMYGARAIPSEWKDVFSDTLQGGVAGIERIAISQAARETYEILKANPVPREPLAATS
ncbi:MAG: hypothetical protein GF331_22905 [Chitinivibrionales bacterium]|nr:hypothetical protein [Chitinivibrionales bacterium]